MGDGDDPRRRTVDLKQYSYKATSNLVLRQERTGRGPRPAAGTDEVAALRVGALDGAMGDRAVPDDAPATAAASMDTKIAKNRKRKAMDAEDGIGMLERGDDVFVAAHHRTAVRQKLTQGQYDDVVAAADEIGLGQGETGYVSKSLVSQRAFEGILAFVMSKMGDQPRDILRDAAEEVLSTLKDQSLREQKRKKFVEGLLNCRLSDDEYARLSGFGRQIKDYGEDAVSDDEQHPRGADARNTDYVDEDQGVAVVFDDEDDEEEQRVNAAGLGLTDDVQYANAVVEPDDDSSIDADEANAASDDAGVPEAPGENDGQNSGRTPLPCGSSEFVGHDDSGFQNSSIVASRLNISTAAQLSGNAENGSNAPIKTASAPKNILDLSSTDSQRTLRPADIDGYWLEREISRFYEDPQECQRMAEKVLDVLSLPGLARSRENQLVLLLGYDKFDLIKLLLKQRMIILYSIRRARASSEEEKEAIDQEMAKDPEGALFLRKFEQMNSTEQFGLAGNGTEFGSRTKRRIRRAALPSAVVVPHLGSENQRSGSIPTSDSRTAAIAATSLGSLNLRKLNFDDLAFSQGSRLLSVKECRLPGTVHHIFKDYEEWHVPARRRKVHDDDNTRLIPIKDLPQWAQGAFPNAGTLNFIQSKVFNCAFKSDENMLLCAPTGAGKTNVAVLAILRVVANSMGRDDEAIRLDNVKVVYVAPMKALVAEVVGNLQKRLDESLGMKVRELTGDVNLTRQEIDDANIIVTTPEKWDIITRKAGERTFTNPIRLLIIDEIHLLHDERGPVLEAIVARTIRSVETTSLGTRILGLSATLPNYRDVASFLRVNFDTSLFHFDATYRPCPLQQCFIGITGKKALKRFQVMNEVTYDKVKGQIMSDNQVIVFVHSRKDTGLTAHHLVEKAIEEEIIDRFMDPGSGSYNIIKSELANVHSQELVGLLERGVAIHHAGMSRKDRTLVEDLFEGGHVKVLVSTATLAWGVNLPAHAVIIRGTQVYSPERGRWVELSPMDVMQMMGRAGRPQFDTQGEGFIITTKAEVLYYLSVLNQQLPIESQMLSCLEDSVNAEIAIGSVSSVGEGSVWLGYTYLFVRMLRNPKIYGISVEEFDSDRTLERRRLELMHTACSRLDQGGLVQYDRHSGHLQSTELGRIASDYYIGHHTMSIYSKHLKPTLGDIDLLRLFAMSGEFKHMRVREEERLELLRLADRVPIPIKESLDEPAAKVNVLLQAYVSNLKLDGLALAADTVYVTQSAARLARALLQLAIEKKWASLVGRCLNLYKAVSKRQWTSQTPLRQFIPAVSDDLLRRIERKDLDFDRYYDLSTAELGEMLRNPTMGKIVHRLVHSLPRMEVQVTRVQPITRALLRIDISLSTDFRFDSNPKIHGSGESFWVWIEDADSESILHIEPFYLRSSLAGEEDFILTFMVPVTNPCPPQYFVRCVSDRWIAPETSVPISFHDLILPGKFPPHTELLELQPLAVRDAFLASGTPEEGIKDFAAYHESLAGLLDYYTEQFDFFNPIQTQAFGALYKSDGNCVLCAPPGSGRLICAELALARLFARQPTAAAVFIAGRGNLVVGRRCSEIQQGIGKALGLVVGELTGESSADVALLRQPGVVVVATPEKWDMFSRRWQLKREGRAISMVQLFVLDDAHLLGENAGHGAVIEVVGSRMRYIAAQAKADGSSPCRIVAILDPVANAKDFGQWLGATPTNVLSFAPSARPVPLEVHIERAIFRAGGGVAGTASALVLPVLRAIRKYIGGSSKPIVVFVASRRLARSLALEIVTMTAGEGDPERFLHSDNSEFSEILDKIRVENLRECISKGVGYVHESMPVDDIRATELLFRAGSIQILVSTANYCWKSAAITGYLTVIAGTSTEETGGLAFCRAEYSLSELWHMIGRAGRPMLDSHGECVILTEEFLVSRYKALLEEPLPIESQLDSVLADQINAEVAAKVVHTKQQAIDFLTWTMFYRRLPLNPNYYSMSGNSHRLMQDHLSDLIEDALSVLESSKCVATVGDEDMDLGALNLGLIASHYYVRHATVELFASQITAKTKLRGLLGLLASAREYDSLPIRPGGTDALKKLSARVPYAVPSIDGALPSFSDPYTKTHLLLQSHLSRLAFAGDLSDDRDFVVGQAVRLLRALVDVIASAGWLEPAISAMELCQLIVQGMWDTDPTVAQLPHLEKDHLSVLQKKYDVKTVDALLEMDEQDRTKAFSKLSRGQVNEIAAACNSFPDLKQISAVPADDEVAPGARVFVHVVLERDSNENDDIVQAFPFVTAPRYPTRKEEGWWIVVGDPTSNTLLSLKYVALSKRARVKLEITAPLVPGNYNLELYLMSDSYVLDCDQQDVFSLTVVTGDGGNDKDVTE